VNTCTGSIEIASHKGVVVGDFVAQLLGEIVGDVGNGRGVNAVVVTHEANVLDDEPFYWGVACTFAKTQKSAVCSRTAIEPGGSSIDEHLVKVIVAMPL